MGIAMKPEAFVFTKNAQNSSKQIIGQKIDFRILPNINPNIRINIV